MFDIHNSVQMRAERNETGVFFPGNMDVVTLECSLCITVMWRSLYLPIWAAPLSISHGLEEHELLSWCLPRCYSRHEPLNQVLRVRNEWRLKWFWDRRILDVLEFVFFCCSALCEGSAQSRGSRGCLDDVEHSAHNLHLHTCSPWGQLRRKDRGEAATALERQRQCFPVSPSINQRFAHIVYLCLL